MIWLWLNNEVPKHRPRPSHVYRGLPIIYFGDQTSFGPANLMTIGPKVGHTNTDGSFKFAVKDWNGGADFHINLEILSTRSWQIFQGFECWNRIFCESFKHECWLL